METIETTWEIWDFDVWGTRKDGYVVNDRYCTNRGYPLTLTVQIANEGSPRQFKYAYPTDKQIKKAMDIKPRARIETEGDDMTIYVTHASTGYPLGEMCCTSHKSLSPIKED